MRYPITDQWQSWPDFLPFSHNSGYWPSRASQVNDVRTIRKGVCHSSSDWFI